MARETRQRTLKEVFDRDGQDLQDVSDGATPNVRRFKLNAQQLLILSILIIPVFSFRVFRVFSGHLIRLESCLRNGGACWTMRRAVPDPSATCAASARR
jgi:hypothetical protein